jgi:hypothetical protein
MLGLPDERLILDCEAEAIGHSIFDGYFLNNEPFRAWKC